MFYLIIIIFCYVIGSLRMYLPVLHVRRMSSFYEIWSNLVSCMKCKMKIQCNLFLIFQAISWISLVFVWNNACSIRFYFWKLLIYVHRCSIKILFIRIYCLLCFFFLIKSNLNVSMQYPDIFPISKFLSGCSLNN